MPTRPGFKTLTNVSNNVLNAIRNQASTNYRDYVPQATPDADSIRAIGAIIMDSPNLQNEFLSALINRIATVLVTSKLYRNPWAMFKRGVLNFGEVVEEIFVALAEPHQYDPELAETELFKRELPNVKSAFHPLNYRKFYKTTIQNRDLKQAFLSYEAMDDFIARIVESLYSGAQYDEYQAMKYMIARAALDGKISAQPLSVSPETDPKNTVAIVKGIANNFGFMSTNFNAAGVQTYTDPDDLIVLIDTKFDAIMDVEVLAAAFNLDRAQFLGQRVLIDGFGNMDIARLNKLFANDPAYQEISADEQATLNTIPLMVVDRNWFMIFDNDIAYTENYNGQGLYWQEFLHVWKTLSFSPFANAVMITPAAPSVADVTINPSSVTVAPSIRNVNFTANVSGDGVGYNGVTWSSNTDGFAVDSAGNVTIAAGTTGEGTITATSVVDPTKTATATITIS